MVFPTTLVWMLCVVFYTPWVFLRTHRGRSRSILYWRIVVHCWVWRLLLLPEWNGYFGMDWYGCWLVEYAYLGVLIGRMKGYMHVAGMWAVELMVDEVVWVCAWWIEILWRWLQLLFACDFLLVSNVLVVRHGVLVPWCNWWCQTVGELGLVPAEVPMDFQLVATRQVLTPLKVVTPLEVILVDVLLVFLFVLSIALIRWPIERKLQIFQISI